MPHSSSGRFEVIIVDFTSYPRRITSKKYSPDRRASGLIPMMVQVSTGWPPCGGCNRPKTGVLGAVLNAEPRLITHLVVDSRAAREFLGQL